MLAFGVDRINKYFLLTKHFQEIKYEIHLMLYKHVQYYIDSEFKVST